MAKKQRGHSELEEMRGQLREKDAIIKSLKKQLAKQGKQILHSEEQEELLKDVLIEEEMKKKKTILEKEKCPECGKTIDPIEIGPRKIIICKNCGYRKIVKK